MFPLNHVDIKSVERKWGHFLQFTENEKHTTKLLFLNRGGSISYQYHTLRSEQWFLVSGRCMATLGLSTEIMMPGMSMFIDVNTKHKLEALQDSVILEISRGKFDEGDIVRI